MPLIKKININGVEYDIGGGGGSSGSNQDVCDITVNTLAELRSALGNGLSPICITKNAEFEISETLIIPNNTILIGNNATLRRATGFEGRIMTVYDRSVVKDFTIDGNREAMVSPAWDKTIEIAVVNNCVVENITINNGNEAIIVYGDNTSVRDCKITNCGGNGIHFSGSDKVIVEHCSVINSNLRAGMGHEDGGIIWSNECVNVTCIGNYIENAKCAFASIDSADNGQVKIIGNTAKNCTKAVEGVFPSSSIAQEVIVTDNEFDNCGSIDFNRTDVETAMVGNWVISNNIFKNTTMWIENLKDAVISNNIFTEMTSSYITIAKCKNISFNNNQVSGSYGGDDSNQLLFYMPDNSFINFIGNNITYSGAGRVINASGTNGMTMKGNIIERTNEAATNECVALSDSVIFSGNRLSFNSGVGVTVSNNSICTDNTIICATAELKAIRVYGGRNNYIVAQNLSNGTFSDISASNTAYIANNLASDAIEFAITT